MIAFVTALECSLRRLRKLLANKHNIEARRLHVSIEMAADTDEWVCLVRPAGRPDILVETRGPDLMSLVHSTTTQVGRELSERRDHYIAAAAAIDEVLRVGADE